MVQIFNLPAKRDPGGQIGSGLGQGLQQGLNTAFNQQFQRSQLQNALAQLQNIPENASPLQLATGLLSSTAGLPDQGRIVSSLFPLLMQQRAGQQAAGAPQPGLFGGPEPALSGGAQAVNQNLPQQRSTGQEGQATPQTISANDPSQLLVQGKKTFQNLPEPANTPNLFQGTLEPTSLGLGPIPNLYTADQIAQAERNDLAQGFKESPQAAFMRRYNESSQNQINSVVAAAQAQSDISERAASRQSAFRSELVKQIGEVDASDQAVAETIANRPEFQNISNDKIRAERVAKEFRTYEAARDEFNRASIRPNPILNNPKYKTALQTLGKKAQFLNKYGQREKTMDAMAKNGWSESEIAKTLNPLNSEINQKIQKLPDFEKPLILTAGTTIPVTERYVKENAKVFDKWGKFLENNIEPGTFDPKNPDVFTPGTSLILLRNAAISKGINAINFDRLLNQAIESGKVQLDPYQQRELQLMSQSPSRTWSVYELLFGGFKP